MEARALEAADRPVWTRLWSGYLRFYRQRLAESVTEATFGRLVDPQSQPHALVAVDAERGVVGFAHFLYHRTTWAEAELCYLEDLFVDPDARGGGGGRCLIEAVYAEADQRGAAGVYWMTQEFNADGRALYDTLAHRTSFIRYER